MARRRRNRDLITTPHRLPSGSWRYRVRDPLESRYRSATFAPDPVADKARTTPGCAAGDAWAQRQRASFALGLDSTAEANTAAIAGEYVAGLNDQRRNATHVADVSRVLDSFAAAAPDLRSKDLPQRFDRWRRGLKAMEYSLSGRLRRREKFELAPRTINRHLGHVQALIKYAVERNYIPRNPLGRVRGVPVDDLSKPVFTIAELRAFVALEWFDDPAWMWAVIMAFTGMRSDEARHVRWQDVDHDAKLVHVRMAAGAKVKRNKERAAPLQADLAALLARHPAKADLGHIIPAEFRGLDNVCRTTRLTRALKAAGIERGARTPHSFRHTYAALMVATREDVFSVCRALGHRDLEMTAHYSREVSAYRPNVEREGWKPGELRLGDSSRPAAAPAAG